MSDPTKEHVLFDIPVWCYEPNFVERMAKLTIGEFLKIDDDDVNRQIHKAKERFNRYLERSKQFGPKTIIVSPDI